MWRDQPVGVRLFQNASNAAVYIELPGREEEEEEEEEERKRRKRGREEEEEERNVALQLVRWFYSVSLLFVIEGEEFCLLDVVWKN